MKSTKRKYISPQIDAFPLILDQSIAAGSASLNTGWNAAGEQNAPKETLWETGWQTSRDFDL